MERKVAKHFDIHAGRNAFRQMSEKARQMSKDLDEMDLDELRRQQFAIRSFTESVDDEETEWPLPPTKLMMMRGEEAQLGRDGREEEEEEEEEEEKEENGWRRRRRPSAAHSDECGTMRESSTADTIVEVLNPNSASTSKWAPQMDPSMGETQKYVMRVPGPELVEQEFELHKSLMENSAEEEIGEEEEERPKQGQQNAKHEQTERATERQKEQMHRPRPAAAADALPVNGHAPSCSFSVPMPSPSSSASVHFAPRPRPTTPTGLSFLRIESFSSPERTSSSVAGSCRMPSDSFMPKMHVVIPMGRGRGAKLKEAQRRYSTGQRDICNWNAPRGGTATQTRNRCGSTAAWTHGADIIESNPKYAGKAPPKPVEHRRSSREWQSFESRDEEAAENGKEKNDGEFIKALEEVRHLIEEVGQKLYQEEEEEKQGIDDQHEQQTDKIDSDEQNKDSPKLSRLSSDRFASAAFPPLNSLPSPSDTLSDAPMASSAGAEAATAHDGQMEQMARAPIRAAPPPPPTAPATNANQKQDTNVEQQNFEEIGNDWQRNETEERRRMANGTDECPTDPTPAENSFRTEDENGTGKNPFGTTEEQINQQYYTEQQQQYGECSVGDYAYDQQQPNENDHQPYSSGFAQTDSGNAEYESEYGNSAVAPDYAGYGMPVEDVPQQLQDNGQYYTQTTQEYGQEQYYEYGAVAQTQLYSETNYEDYNAPAQTSYTQQQDFVQYDASVPAQSFDQTDFSKYGTPIPTEQPYSDATTDFSQYGAPPAPNPFVSPAADQTEGDEPPPLDTSVYGVPPSRPSVPSFLAQPAFPAQRARTPDPFSWEAQESAYEEHGTAVVPKRPMTSPWITEGKETAEKGDEGAEGAVQKGEQAGPPPPRPPNAPPPPCRPAAPSPARPPAPPSPRPARKAEQRREQQQEAEEAEEDAWKRFQKMTERVGAAMKSTEQRLGQLENEPAVPDDALVQEYLSHTGGGTQLTAVQRQQIAEQEAERKRMKQEKKRKKLEKGIGQLGAAIGERMGALKRAPSPPADPKTEIDLEKASADLARKIAAQHGFELESGEGEEKQKEAMGEEKRERDETEEKGDEPAEEEKRQAEERTEEKAEETKGGAAEEFEADFSKLDAENPAKRWAAAFEQATLMPPSDSEVNLAHKMNSDGPDDPFDTSAALEGTKRGTGADPFAPMPTLESSPSFDPFEVIPVEELIAKAREKAELERAKREAEHEGEFVAENRIARPNDRLSASHLSSPTPEGGSPVSSVARPVGFDDDFKGAQIADDESPLFDADDSLPLPEFPLPFTGDGWELFLRYPPKKKLMTDRFWKPIYVRMSGNMLAMFTNREETRPAQEILIQANYSLSDIVLQPYDVFTKIHTVKLQHILYKERIGIRPGQISRLVEGHLTKYGLPLEHAAQCTVLAKFGSLNERTIASFTDALENVLFHCPAKRETAPTYKQDEVQIHCYDEYEASVDKEGNVSNQRARVRLFCLAFLSGTSFLEIGLNDRRREGKEVVRRKDILPMYTERWIRFEAPELHETVDKGVWEEDQVLRINPPDACFFEVMHFRVRPPRNRDRALNVKCLMRMAGSHIELRIDAMAVAHQQRARGTAASTRAVPCEDIVVRFPLPEAWIYLFREQRPWGVGSVHSKQRKPGKVKNLRDKLMGTVQHNEPSLIEVGIGEAKYEHLYRSLVWRIPRLPERESAIYKSYMLKCRFELSSFDLMPDHFEPCAVVEFTMPLAVISNTVVRSVGVEQHEDSESVEKFVRYVAKCKYSLEIDYQQCSDLDNELATNAAETEEPPEPSRHLAAFDPKDVQQRHEGYRIELPDDRTNSTKTGEENGDDKRKRRSSSSSSSSSDEDGGRKAFPVVQIDMKGYGY
ncbi:hypothetical protein niasHS_017842 [Heterodera schachtii]|uniref:Uncharacterized protein n=1 Tax=Heterodera schachtii TaxID=97005 RepID=A0ABD2I1K7_HETSC